VRILALCLPLAACATGAPFPDPAGRLAAGVEIAAPQGLIDMCTRAPAECDLQFAPEGLLRRLGEAPGATAQADDQASRQAGASAVFQTLLASREDSVAAASADIRDPVTLTPKLWAQLREANHYVNTHILPMTDLQQYGVDGYWTRPLRAHPELAYGDCKDYALEKRARLLAEGWARDSLALAIAMAPGVGLHAVLIVETDRGDFALDSLEDEPRAATSLNYVWLSRQAGPDITHWTTVRPVSGGAPFESADLSAEDMFHRLLSDRARSTLIAGELGAPAEPPKPLLLAPDPIAPPAPKLTIAPIAARYAGGVFARLSFDGEVDLTPVRLRQRTGESAQ